MKKSKYVLFFLGMVFLVLGFGRASAAEMSFAVQAVIPDNQIDKSQSYFDLRMSPGQGQDLAVDLRNDGAQAVTVEVLPNTAITNQNGIVEYNNTTTKQDSTLKTSFKSIATTDKEVTIPAKSTKQIKVHVQMPAATYDGTILGGIYFTEKVTKEADKNAKESQINNRYAYVIGVKLTETDKVVQPELKLTSVKATQVNYRNVIAANIQNTQAAIVKDLKIDGTVSRKGSDKVLYSASREALRMAPNSNFDFGVSLNNQAFQPGKYTFRGVAKSGDQTWKFERDFEIKGTVAKGLNKAAVSLKRDYSWLYALIAFLVVFVLLVIILLLMRQLRRAKDKNEQRK